MNEEAANKILKILEEPWEKTAFPAGERGIPTGCCRRSCRARRRWPFRAFRPRCWRRWRRGTARAIQRGCTTSRGWPEAIMLELQRLLAGEDDELTRRAFRTVLLAHAAELQRQTPRTGVVGRGGARISRANSSGRSCATRRVCCARATCSTPDWPTSATCGAPKPDFCRKFAPFIGNAERGVPARRDRTGDGVRSRRTAIRRSSSPTSR